MAIVVGYLANVVHPQPFSPMGDSVHDTARTDLDGLYDPRHVPVIPVEIQWVIEPWVMGITAHQHIQCSSGYYTDVLYVCNREPQS